jgi:hypothetical protein
MNPKQGFFSRQFNYLAAILRIPESSPLNQPVNFFLSVLLILLFGLVTTSLVLDEAGYREINPLIKLGEGIAMAALIATYGDAAFNDVIVP